VNDGRAQAAGRIGARLETQDPHGLGYVAAHEAEAFQRRGIIGLIPGDVEAYELLENQRVVIREHFVDLVAAPRLELTEPP
jgi:hypothetical protein